MATIASGGNILDFTVCQSSDCTSFDFSETTLEYTSTNPGGWANSTTGVGVAVNFVPADAISAYVTVTLPNGTVCSPISVYSTFPDSTGQQVWTISNTNLGLSGSLPDGLYTINYEVNISNVNNQTIVLTTTKQFLFTCTIWCCVQRLAAKLATEECGCESNALKNALLAHGLYKSLLHSGSCGNTTNVSNLLARLQKLCNVTNCGCN